MCDDLVKKAASISYQRALQWELRCFILRNGANPMLLSYLRKIPRQRPREQLAPDKEFEDVYAIASNRLRLSMVLARDAALRRSAIESFNRNNVDWEHNEVVGITKAKATYRVPMTHRLRSMLSLLCACADDDTPLIAQVGRKRQPVKACTLLWELKDTQKKLGGMKWGMHDLRRTAARQLYDRTHDIRKVQRLLGHASPMATWWYIGNNGQSLSSAELEPIQERAS